MAAAAENPVENVGRVLVVDDLAEVRRAHSRLLKSGGFEVHQAKSAEEALALLAMTTFDVVLSDVHMPDSNGVALLRELRERDPELSVVLVSGSPDLPTALEAIQFGAHEYMIKPITREKLQTTIARAVEICRQRRGTRSEMERLRSGERLRQPPDVEPKKWVGVLLGGRYRLGGVIGEGGMGVVYEAAREDLGGMPVAVKLVHPDLRFDESLLRRLRREAEAMASIHHPNIVQVIDFQTPPDSPPFIVMELLSGVPLAETVAAAGALAVPRALSIAQQVLSALGAAHERGIVHRDLKPENVFLTRLAGLGEVVKVLDFGIAKRTEAEGDARLTRTGATLGTPAYMAPEQARGQAVTVRTDLYAVGCLIYEMLAGRPPFRGENYNAVLASILEGEAPSLAKQRPELPLGLVEVIEKAMRKSMRRRFGSAAEMSEALVPWTEITGRSGPPSEATTSSAPTQQSEAPPLAHARQRTATLPAQVQAGRARRVVRRH